MGLGGFVVEYQRKRWRITALAGIMKVRFPLLAMWWAITVVELCTNNGTVTFCVSFRVCSPLPSGSPPSH